MGHGLCSSGKRVELEDSHRAVPENGLGVLHRLGEQSDGGRADVHPIPTFGDLLHGHDLGFGTGLTTGCHDAVHGKIEFHPPQQSMFLDAPGKVQHIVLDQRVADFHPHRLEEREGHPASDNDLVHALPQVLDHPDFPRDFGSAQDRHERSDRIGDRPLQIFDLLLHEVAGGGRLDEFRNAHDRRMRAMGGSEGVVDIDIGERGERPRKRVVVFLLARVKTEVFQEEHVARLHPGHQFLYLRPDAIRREDDFFAQETLEPSGDRCEAVARVRFALRAAQVGAQDDLGPLIHGTVDGGQRGADPGIVGDLMVVVERDVEVSPDDDALVAKIGLLDRPLTDGHLRSPARAQVR